MLNSECGKWRDNAAGVGDDNDLSARGQMQQMAYCMAQDCAQSMEEVSCRYTDENGLCYTNPGQGWCQDYFARTGQNAGNSQCVDHGDEMGPDNLDGPGTWEPLDSVPLFGSAALSTQPPRFTCNCFKNCAHYTGSDALKKYRCTGGLAVKVGTIEGSPAADAVISSSSKTGQCACSCGIPGTDEWYAQDAQ